MLPFEDLGRYFLVKYDSLGDIVWYRTPENGGNGVFDLGIDDYENTYALGVFSDSLAFINNVLVSKGINDVFIAQYSKDGNLKTTASIGGQQDDIGYNIGVSSNKNIFITGFFESNVLNYGNGVLNNTGNRDFFLLKSNQNLTHVGNFSLAGLKVSIYPNPATNSFFINTNNKTYHQIIITDINGRVVYTRSLRQAQATPVEVKLHQPPGMYFIKLSNEKEVVTGKIIIQQP